MGSPIRDSATGGALSSFVFAESGGYSRRETEELCPAVGYVSDDHRAFLAPEHRLALAPEATGPSRLPGSSRLDKLYEPHFRRLDRGLLVLKTQQLIVSMVQEVPQIHVPTSETEGYVPGLGMLDGNAKVQEVPQIHVPTSETEGYVPGLGMLDGNAKVQEVPQIHVPTSETEGYVPGLGMLDGNAKVQEVPQIHVPTSETEGYVLGLGMLDGNAEGGIVFGSILEKREALVKK